MTRQAYGETFPGYARSKRAPLLMKPGRQQAYLRRKSGYESCLLIALCCRLRCRLSRQL